MAAARVSTGGKMECVCSSKEKYENTTREHRGGNRRCHHGRFQHRRFNSGGISVDKNCGYCHGAFLTNEDKWVVDGVPLHITLRPGSDGTDPKDTCFWAYRRQARKGTEVIWPATVFQLKWSKP